MTPRRTLEGMLPYIHTKMISFCRRPTHQCDRSTFICRFEHVHGMLWAKRFGICALCGTFKVCTALVGRATVIKL